ncbi:MAG: restriction alleviation protein, Lar family [Candidatus Coatesbacteria bacterium]|nr:restriction alleviation protein, Lar family [Candidatus Coatesbacteria bacterium]
MTAGTQAEVKRCPFCGSRSVRLHGQPGGDWSVECLACNAWGPYCPSREMAVKEWNQAPRG